MSSPYTGDDPFVYISYVREDHSLVVDDIDRLVDLGVRCYWGTGDEPDAERLKAASFFIAMVSDSTEYSEALLKETGMALRESKESACFWLADVPLDGKAELLLKGITDVKKYRMSDSLYLRWLANSLPEGVKTREIVIPKEEPKAVSAAAPRSKSTGGGGNEPPLLDRLKEVDPKIWGVVGVFCLLFVIALIAMSGDGDGDGKETASKTSAKTSESSVDPNETAEARAAREQREAERKKQLEISQRGEEAKWTLKEMLRKGEDKFRDEDWDGAIKAVTSGIEQPHLIKEKLATDMAKAYLLRAQAYGKKRKRAEAIADYQSYVKLKTDDPEAWYALGGLLKQLKKYKEAIAAYGELLKVDPQRTLGWRYQGDCYRLLKQYDKAHASYTKNIEIDPKDAAAYRYRARVRQKLGDEQGASDDMAKSSEIINNR